MKNLLIAFMAISVMLLAGCSKKTNEIAPSPGGLKSQNPVPISGNAEGVLYAGGTAGCSAPGTAKYMIAQGIVTHLGNTDMRCDYCITVTNPSPSAEINGTVEGSGVLTAADGDLLYATISGTFKLGGWQGTYPNIYPTTNTITALGTFTGGTGKFEDATGTFDSGGVVSDLLASPQPITYWMDGTIQY